MHDLLKTLPSILRAAGEAAEVREAAAFAAWRHLAGAALLDKAVPFRLYNKQLIIAVPDETWRKQLAPLAAQMLFKLNGICGQLVVEYIEFRVDAATVNAARAANYKIEMSLAEREYRALKAVGGGLEDYAVAKIKDPELRRKFLLAAGSQLASREMKINRDRQDRQD